MLIESTTTSLRDDDQRGLTAELPGCLRPKGEHPTVRESVAICDWFKDQAAMRATRVAATAVTRAEPEPNDNPA